MTAYTVFLWFNQFPRTANNVDDFTVTWSAQQVTTADPPSAVTAAIAQYNASFAAGVDIPYPHGYVVVAGSLSIAQSGQLSHPQPNASQGRF